MKLASSHYSLPSKHYLHSSRHEPTNTTPKAKTTFAYLHRHLIRKLEALQMDAPYGRELSHHKDGMRPSQLISYTLSNNSEEVIIIT